MINVSKKLRYFFEETLAGFLLQVAISWSFIYLIVIFFIWAIGLVK